MIWHVDEAVLLQRRADGTDAAVHHVGRCHHVGPGGGMESACFTRIRW